MKRKKISILEYNLEKEFVRKFESMKDASKELRMSHSTIRKYAQSNKPYKGRILSFIILTGTNTTSTTTSNNNESTDTTNTDTNSNK
jgi:hypothetical protein